MPICQNCGKLNEEGSNFCKQCGSKIIIENNQEEDYSDEYNPAYGRLTKIAAKKLDNSKLVDKFIDVTTPHNLRIDDNMGDYGRKYWESLEKEFLEVYETIDDSFLRALFILERNKIGGGGNIGATALSMISTPTRHLSYEESIEFYENLLKKVKRELDIEKQNSNFSEREYYKKKYKEYFVENMSNMGVPRHLR